MSYTGNGYKYLSVGLYFWQWLDPSTFQINSLSLSDPSGTRSGATDVSANPDATFELIDIVSGGAVYDITFKSEDGTVTYDQVAGTVSNPNQWGATGGDFPTLASIYSTVPVKQGQDGVEYEFAGWVDETGAPGDLCGRNANGICFVLRRFCADAEYDDGGHACSGQSGPDGKRECKPISYKQGDKRRYHHAYL